MMYTRITLAGINTDVDPIEINGGAGSNYQAVNNMIAKPGKMARASGWQWQWYIDNTPGSEQGSLFAPYYLSYSPQLGLNYWVYAGADGLASIDEGWGHNDITPIAGIVTAGEDSWTGGNLNGIAIFNSPENDALYWYSGLGTAAVLPGLRPGTRYNVMRPHKYHIIGLGRRRKSGNPSFPRPADAGCHGCVVF